jgi:lipase chaperone LimK
MPHTPDEHDRTDELRELARYARQRHDLYRARVYGPRATSASRLRELERESDQAQARLDAYIAERARMQAG